MNPILNKMVPNRKVQIEIIRDDFASPILGNIYIGQKHTLNISTAKRFVEEGYAKFVDEQGAVEKGEEKKQPETTADENKNDAGGDDNAAKPDLAAALKLLDPADDAHWTKGGQPDLNVLKELTGVEVKRKEVETAAPDFTREVAKAAAAQ